MTDHDELSVPPGAGSRCVDLTRDGPAASCACAWAGRTRHRHDARPFVGAARR